MIIVIGQLLYCQRDQGEMVDGLAARMALAATGTGRSVQFVGKTGEDPEGDAVLLALARGGVGHVAVLRDAGMATQRIVAPVNADLDSGLGDGVADVSAPGATEPSHGHALDAADIELALRYLTDFAVLVLAEPADDAIARVITTAAEWADARLVVVMPAGGTIPDGLPPDAIVFEAPDEDPDGVFAEMVGAFAAALDDGNEPAKAFRASVEAAGWTPAPAD